MNKKANTTILTLSVIVALLIGGLIGAVGFPRTIEVPGECEECQVCQVDVCPVVNPEIIEVTKDYVGDAVAEFMDEVENDDDFDDLLKCGDDRYEFDQISISKVYDDASITFTEVDTDDLDDAEAYDVDFKIRLKYSDPDVEEKCYDTFNVTVEYEEGEAPNVSVD